MNGARLGPRGGGLRGTHERGEGITKHHHSSARADAEAVKALPVTLKGATMRRRTGVAQLARECMAHVNVNGHAKLSRGESIRRNATTW